MIFSVLSISPYVKCCFRRIAVFIPIIRIEQNEQQYLPHLLFLSMNLFLSRNSNWNYFIKILLLTFNLILRRCVHRDPVISLGRDYWTPPLLVMMQIP